MSEGQESERMDKKTGRQSSVAPKGNGSESKKENGSNTQKCPRSNRRKENGTRSDQSQNRRSNPQKCRYVDKRPRSRGFTNESNREQVTFVEETEPEYGSVQSWGSKKSNMNHLLNFHFEARECYDRGGHSKGNRNRPFRNKGLKYNQEHFLQANCQFVVRTTGDYSVHTVDPDILVDWDLIEQVRIYSYEVPSCPVCLYPPTAAKITRCGHIYCWTCMLHYLSLGDKIWRRCPICYEAVHEKDLKSMISLETRMYKVGDEITMKLMKRRKVTNLCMPVDQWQERDGQLFNIKENIDLRYAKLLTASAEQIQEQIIQTEQAALLKQLEEDGADTLEGSFVEAALKLLEERMRTVTMQDSVEAEIEEQISKLMLEQKEEEVREMTDSLMKKAKNAIVYKSAFSDDEDDTPAPSFPKPASLSLQRTTIKTESDGKSQIDTDHALEKQEESEETHSCDQSEITDDGLEIGAVGGTVEDVPIVVQEYASENAYKKSSEYFYFFQAADGQHIYTHSVNARCLIKEYGSLENCPRMITANILEIEDISMNEDLRGRLRYLGHLPVTCEFQVAELALKPPLISKETLKLFQGEIDKRKKQRQRKHREEKRFTKRIQEMEIKEMGIDPRAVIVPSEAPSMIIPSASKGLSESQESSVVGSPSSDSVEQLASSPRSSDDGQTLSFAQMLRAGKAKQPEAWPKVSSGATLSPGTKAGSDSDSEDRVPVPQYSASFGDAIQKALDTYKLPHTDEVAIETSAAVGKKKKKQKTLLFSTSMSRAK